MGYQFFTTQVSNPSTQKLVFVQVGDGSANSGSFFINNPEIFTDGNEARFVCLDREPHSSDSFTHFAVNLHGVEALQMKNSRTTFEATLTSRPQWTKLAWGGRHAWNSPSANTPVLVYIERPFAVGLTELTDTIARGDSAELTLLRNLANPASSALALQKL